MIVAGANRLGGSARSVADAHNVDAVGAVDEFGHGGRKVIPSGNRYFRSGVNDRVCWVSVIAVVYNHACRVFDAARWWRGSNYGGCGELPGLCRSSSKPLAGLQVFM